MNHETFVEINLSNFSHNILAIANKEFEKAMADDPELRKGLNVLNSQVCYPAVAGTFDMNCATVDF